MADHVTRGMRTRLVRDLAVTPVVVLEGLRAAGKTWLARSLQDDGFVRTFVDLTDGATLQRFRSDPDGAIADVATPAVIDEVQLVPDLLLGVKRIADREPVPGTFLLTGSARIHTDQLGGADPLAGRAQRTRLRPLTQGERAGTPVQLVERLFAADLEPGSSAGTSRSELARRVATGGLPTIAGVLGRRGSLSQQRSQQLAYIEAVLAVRATGPQRDEAALRRTFRYLAGSPAQILVTERAASELGLNRKTVDAYVDELEARFLVERLPAWRPTGSASARAHPKLHITDSGLGSAAGTNRGPLGDDAAFGSHLESFVVMEVLAQAAWTDLGVHGFHWRDAKTKREVDLVLVDSLDRMIAIEIKAATVASRSDLQGIDALAERHPVHLGVVFYTGDEVRELAPGRWAVPIDLLWAPATGGSNSLPRHPTPPTTQEPTVPSPEPTSAPPSDAALFLSYVHADDAAEHGRITALAEDLATRFELLTGESLPVFVDTQIEWGQQWKLRLDQELARTTFFVPVVTPRFLASESCRAEVLEFVAKAKALGLREFVMPVLYFEPPGWEASTDPVVHALRDAQYEDWTELIYLDRTDGAYRRAIDRLVVRLRRARDDASTAVVVDADELGDTGGDLLDSVEQITELVESLETDRLPTLMAAFEGLGAGFEAVGPAIERAGASSSPRLMRAALREAVEPLQQPAAFLQTESQATSALMTGLDEAVAQILAVAAEADSLETLGLDELLESLATMTEGLDLDVHEIREVQTMVRQLVVISRDMRPIADAIDAAVRVFTDIDLMTKRWATDARRQLGQR